MLANHPTNIDVNIIIIYDYCNNVATVNMVLVDSSLCPRIQRLQLPVHTLTSRQRFQTYRCLYVTWWIVLMPIGNWMRRWRKISVKSWCWRFVLVEWYANYYLINNKIMVQFHAIDIMQNKANGCSNNNKIIITKIMKLCMT